KFCWDLLIGKDPTFSQVTSVEVVDPLTLKVNLKQFDNQILQNLSRGAGAVFSPTAFKENGEEWLQTHPIGTGPWLLKEFLPDQVMRLERNPDYWDKELPYLDSVEIQMITDANTALASLKAGELDALNNIDPISAAELKAEGVFTLQGFFGPTIMLEMNTTDPTSVWTDIRMRQALEYAIDKEGITEAVGLGFMIPSYEICKGIHDITDPGTTPRTYDVEKAKQLMAEAGHADGLTVKLTYDSGRNPPDIIAALQASLAEVNITLELNGLAGAAYNQASFEPEPGSGLRLEGQRGGSPNVLNGVNETLSERSIFFPGVKRPEGWQGMIDEALQKEDLADATPILVDMEKAAYDDVMMVPLWIVQFVSAYDAAKVNDIDFFFANAPAARFDLAWLTK
ncbi:MAG: ABC transporter substrate-binding protein, partial [Thermoleophilia bacterium]